MRYPQELREGKLQKRMMRFLADVAWSDGTVVRAHVPNTGSLLGCLEPGQPARLSAASDPARRCPYTLEQLCVGEVWVGVHTHRANPLVGELLQAGTLPSLAGYAEQRAEVPYGRQRSRIDWLLRHPGRADCYVEVKSVTTSLEPGVGLFPDAPSERARKHLDELAWCVSQGWRGVLVFCVQRADVRVVRPAEKIDSAYAAALRRVAQEGVEMLALSVRPEAQQLEFQGLIPVEL